MSKDESIKVDRYSHENGREWTIQSHFHKKCEIVLYGTINGVVALNGLKKKIEKGQLLYLPPYAVHGFKLSEGKHIYTVMHLYHDCTESHISIEDLPVDSILITLDKRENKLLESLFSVLRSDSLSTGIRKTSIQLILQVIIEKSKTNVLPRDHTNSIRFQSLFVYLNNNSVYTLSAGQAAAICNMSRSSFLRNFKQNYNICFHEFLQLRQIEEAAYLLRQTERRCIDIAYDLGFTDASHFSKVFKKKTGESPLVYRRKEKNKIIISNHEKAMLMS